MDLDGLVENGGAGRARVERAGTDQAFDDVAVRDHVRAIQDERGAHRFAFAAADKKRCRLVGLDD